MMESKRIIGLDVGSHTIGVAVSDPLGWTASGLKVIRRKRLEDDLKQLLELFDYYQVEKIIIGLPKNMNNTLGPQAQYSLDFAEILKEQSELPIIMWDERLSTKSAERALIEGGARRKKRRQVIDKIAAAVILQSYLDAQQVGNSLNDQEDEALNS